MFKTFSRLLIILVLVAAGGVMFLMLSRDTDKDLKQKYVTEARTHAALIGAFMQHVIDERNDRLKIVAAIENDEVRNRSLAEYAVFVKDHYDTQGNFGVGQIDASHKATQTIDYGGTVCSAESLVDVEMLKRLKSGRAFIGMVTDACRKESLNKNPGFIIIYPIMKQGVFYGAVYDVFTVLGDASNVWASTAGGSSVELVLADKAKYPENSFTRKMLKLRSKAVNNVIACGGRYIGYYNFKIDNAEFCLIYGTGKYVSRFMLGGGSLADNFNIIIVVSPLLILFILIIVELFMVKRRLEIAVEDRTKHLENLKNKYEGLFRTIPEYVVLHGADGIVLEQNKKCGELGCCTGGQDNNIYDHIKDKSRFMSRVALLKKGITDYLGEYVIHTTEGPITASVSSTLVDTDSGVAVLSAFTDITEYKTMQNSFFLSQKREVIGTLAAGMAHDFSNILQNISLQYGLAERAAGSDRRDEHLENISGIVDGARKYLQGIMRYAKNSGETAVVRSGAELTRAAVEIAGQIVPPDISLKFTDRSEGLMIKMEEGRYMQMLVNLCQNSSDAMDKEGVIEITAERAEKPFGVFFILRVKDAGRGISPHDLQNIFKPFYTTRDGVGTGLGLASVRQTVMDAGGMIDVKSEPGEGSEFIIMIPETK